MLIFSYLWSVGIWLQIFLTILYSCVALLSHGFHRMEYAFIVVIRIIYFASCKAVRSYKQAMPPLLLQNLSWSFSRYKIPLKKVP